MRDIAKGLTCLTLGVVMPGSALAQDALQCSARESAWCTGQEWFCPFNFQDCMKACEGPERAPVPHIDPCYLAQNALRPCTSEPMGVDSNVVGTWEIMVPNQLGVSRWVWEIRQNGTYNFHAEGPGAAPAHSGTLAASRGHCTLNSTTLKYSDAGTYQLVANVKLIATGGLGTGTWQRAQPKVAGDSGNGK